MPNFNVNITPKRTVKVNVAINQGAPGPNRITEQTATPIDGVLVGEGGNVRPANPGEVLNEAAMQSALLAWLPALPRSMPAEPNMAWIDGDVVKVSAAWVMTGGVWDDSGSWMDSQIWSDN